MEFDQPGIVYRRSDLDYGYVELNDAPRPSQVRNNSSADEILRRQSPTAASDGFLKMFAKSMQQSRRSQPDKPSASWLDAIIQLLLVKRVYDLDCLRNRPWDAPDAMLRDAEHHLHEVRSFCRRNRHLPIANYEQSFDFLSYLTEKIQAEMSYRKRVAETEQAKRSLQMTELSIAESRSAVARKSVSSPMVLFHIPTGSSDNLGDGLRPYKSSVINLWHERAPNKQHWAKYLGLHSHSCSDGLSDGSWIYGMAYQSKCEAGLSGLSTW